MRHVLTDNEKQSFGFAKLRSFRCSASSRGDMMEAAEKHSCEAKRGVSATDKDHRAYLSNECRIVYVVGAPGSGKTTQCSKIATEFGYCHLSAGDILQEEIESGPENGEMIQELKKEGKLVPSEIIVKLLQQAMQRSEIKKFLIDGFPRSEENRTAAEEIMKIEPDLVLLLDCSEGESTRRLLKRNQGRLNDNDETIRKRLRVYSESTTPVISYYNSKGKLRKVDAERPIEDVYQSVKGLFSEQ